jgi:hypothetical protein
MLTLTEIFSIIIIHWIADFVLQTDKQAKGKSKNWEDLLLHTSTYSIVWLFFPLILYFFGIPFSGKILLFILITFIAHTITDYYTSRVNSALWDKGDVHNFFVSVGFDQVLYYVQLFLTYYLLKS